MEKKSSHNIQEFDRNSDHKIKDFYSSKRPVYLELNNSPGYKTLVLNSRSKVRNFTFLEVAFKLQYMCRYKYHNNKRFETRYREKSQIR